MVQYNGMQYNEMRSSCFTFRDVDDDDDNYVAMNGKSPIPKEF